MKHILIIISLLLLSSPVIGNSHKGETLYRWGTIPFSVWKGYSNKISFEGVKWDDLKIDWKQRIQP